MDASAQANIQTAATKVTDSSINGFGRRLFIHSPGKLKDIFLYFYKYKIVGFEWILQDVVICEQRIRSNFGKWEYFIAKNA